MSMKVTRCEYAHPGATAPGTGSLREDVLEGAKRAFEADGAVLITGVPVEDDDALLEVCFRFGTVTREGNGPPPGTLIRDLIWSPEDGDSKPLTMHTDSAFAEYPHAAMALACVAAAGDGWGRSILVRADEVVAALDEADVHTLRTCPVTFTKRRDGTVQQEWSAPVLAMRAGRQTLRFHRDHLAAVGPVPLVGALERLTRALDDPRPQARVDLRPGDLVILDNLRVLHGRTALAGSSFRHLRRLKMLALLEDA